MKLMLLLLTVAAFIANPQEACSMGTTPRNVDSVKIKRPAEIRLSQAAQEFSLRLKVLREGFGAMNAIEFALDASIAVFIEERNYHENIAKRAHLRRMELIDAAARDQFPEYPTSHIYKRFKTLSQRVLEEQ